MTPRAMLAPFMLLAATAALAADALPLFTVAYFNGSCPAGWSNTGLGAASGRFIVPTMPGGGVGSFSGTALSALQAPTHEHRLAVGSITVSSKRFILIDGCCNESLGSSGVHTMSGSASPAPENLPYVQYNVCMKQAAPEPGTIVPAGVTTFHVLPSCPEGWDTVAGAAGRYIVGLHSTGLPAATYGGKPLTPGEVRTHGHTMNGSIDLPRHNIAGASGCCANNYAGSGATAFTGNTVVDAKTTDDSAVQAPYYTATFCRKR